MTKRNGTELITGVITLVLAAAAAVLFCLSYTTGYYIFGQMNSGLIALLLGAGVVVGVAAIVLRGKFADKFWPKLLTFAVTALLAAAAMLLIGDRVEGIGNCIITDYDSGHGGEEAIYMSLAASILLLAGVVYNIIGSFAQDRTEEPSAGRKIAGAFIWGVTALAVLLGVILPTANLVGGKSAAGGAADVSGGEGGVYMISFNANNGNVEGMPKYQFLCSDFSGILAADSRFFIDVTLTLDGSGNYTLFADGYCVDNGARCVVGDDSGLGQVLTMNAEGTYTESGDGTITTAVPDHAVFEMEMDTYSSQMKGAVQMNVNGSDADGVYDSDDEPAVLDFVPETVWTLSGEEIVNYRNAASGGTYTVSYNVNNGNAEDMPDYQFLCADFSGMVAADSRFFVDVSLTLDGNGHYTLFTDSYCVDNGARCVIGDDTGLGLVLTMNAEGAYTENDDGTVTTSVPDHAVFEMGTDTYSAQMKGAVQMNVNGSDADGVYDSNDEPAVLDFVPETVWTLDSGAIVTYYSPNAGVEEGAEPDRAGGVTFPSDDGATTMTFYPDGTYRFFFEAYNIEDFGTYTYENGVLTLTDANGAQTAAEGDPLAFVYVYSQSDQLTGTFSVAVAELETLSGGAAPAGVGEPVTVPSDDGATAMTFNPDGTYLFAFEAYGVEDAGTYTFEDGVLTLTDANEKETTAEGDPLKFTYTFSQSDQLTGDFTVSAADLNFEGSAAAEPVTVPSDDGATTMTFNPDGTYLFAFEAYGVEDAGTYTFENGVLTLTDANGKETSAEGDPLKLTYTFSQSDQLTGDFTVNAADLNFDAAGGTIEAVSDDGGTTMTFNPDGTYVFAFEAYGIEDPGTWIFEGGKLTVTNANGDTAEAEGDPLKLHYVSAVSDQLTGDFTIPAADFAG